MWHMTSTWRKGGSVKQNVDKSGQRGGKVTAVWCWLAAVGVCAVLRVSSSTSAKRQTKVTHNKNKNNRQCTYHCHNKLSVYFVVSKRPTDWLSIQPVLTMHTIFPWYFCSQYIFLVAVYNMLYIYASIVITQYFIALFQRAALKSSMNLFSQLMFFINKV